MRIVVALGGNALLERGESPDAAIQLHHVRTAAAGLAPLAAEHDLIICHGNGPQVGLLALESEADTSLSRPYPLDVLGAQTQGMIGYWLAQSLRNAGVTKPVVSITTQTVIDPAAAFDRPTKFVGAVYTQVQARHLTAERGWVTAPDGEHWRRVVPSPEPQRVIELDTITDLLASGSIVICGGGGGVPVVYDDGQLRGVEAVIDKDLTAALLAVAVRADRFIVLTDVAAVMDHFGSPQQKQLRNIDINELSQLTFAAGSMAPKIAACSRFVDATGSPAAIGALRDAADILAGTAGTTLSRSPLSATATRT